MNTKLRNIPFSPPDMSEEEVKEVCEALRSGWITTGPRTKEFERQIAEGNLLEYAEFVGNYYGTPNDKVEEQLNRGKEVILEIEVNGALQVREQCKDAAFIFLVPPTRQALYDRLMNRGTESEEVVLARIAKANKEFKLKKQASASLIKDNKYCFDLFFKMKSSK
jgi:guanylate kinase